MPRTRLPLIHFSLLILALILTACAGGGAAPKSGTTYTGNLIIERIGATGRALGGTISFTVSEDGTGIAKLAYTLEGDVCKDQGVTVTGTGASLNQDPPPAIEDGSFVWLSEGVRVEGEFTSRNRAEGTVILAMEKEVDALGEMMTLTCDYGQWVWTAQAE